MTRSEAAACLFVPQGDQGIDAGGAARGEEAGGESNDGEEEWHQREGEEIVRLDAIEDGIKQLGDEKSDRKTDDEGDEDELRALAEDEAEDRRRFRAQGHANADFASAQRDEVR